MRHLEGVQGNYKGCNASMRQLQGVQGRYNGCKALVVCLVPLLGVSYSPHGQGV